MAFERVFGFLALLKFFPPKTSVAEKINHYRKPCDCVEILRRKAHSPANGFFVMVFSIDFVAL
jgi:hypothetical protein